MGKIATNKKGVISLSGGLDSTSLALFMLSSGYEVRAYGFDYGQKHSIELERVQKNVKLLQDKGLPITFQVIDLKSVFNESTSSLKEGNGDIPRGHYEDENMKSTVVEIRCFYYLYSKVITIKNNSRIITY